MLKSSASRVRATSNKGPNNTTAQQTTKKLENSNQRTQTSGTSQRTLSDTSAVQTVEPNGNHVIFLRGIRSDNGKIILTRDDNIRLQDGVLTVTNINKNTGSEKNDNEPRQHQQPNKTTVLVESGAEFGLPDGARRVNGTPVLFYTSSGPSDLTNGNVAFVSNDELNLSEFTENLVSHSLANVEKPLEPELKIHCTPLGSDGEPIKLPENLESLPKADHFPIQRHRWNTNEEIAAILISFERHSEWQSKEVRIRPKSGSMLLYSRKKVRYRRDGYCWKKRKDGKTTREDHMKLKVQGTECIYGCYVHSAILPTFHRRCYWLLQNPDIVLVHYLNVPYPDDNKLSCITPSLALWADKKEWTKEELVSQLKPMFFSEDEPDINNELEISTAETVEAIVSQLMEKQRAARQAALVKQLECGCPDSTCAADGKQCSHPMRRIRGAEPTNNNNTGTTKGTAREDSNQVSSTTGCGKKTAGAGGGMILSTNVHSPRIYARESRIHHHHHQQQTSLHQNTATSTPPLVLSLSQIQGGGGLLILNSSANTSTHTAGGGGSHQSLVSPVAVTSFVCNNSSSSLRHHSSTKKTLVLKQEAMDTNTNCLHTDHQLNKMDITNGNITELYESLSFGRQDKHLQHQTTEMLTPSKRMDTGGDHGKHQNFCGETVVLLDAGNKNDINSGFFNETLDLSQEDIQRTLSANMPMCELEQNNGHGATATGTESMPNKQQTDEVGQDAGVIVSEMNPMDFMDGTDIVVSPTHVVDDDVFVNLDAFDMLGEFPELEVLDGSATGGLLDVGAAQETNSTAATGDKSAEQQSPHMDYREGTANITDYSPEWAYPEGGVKVLVTGPWYSTTSPYTVLFDTFPVPTTLVQSGVLRCYCPAHEAGLATLQVACEGFVISNSVIFEYKLPPHEETSAAPDTKVERSSDNLLKFTLLHRLEAMDDRLQIKQEPEGNDSVEDSALFTHPSFEDRLVLYCQTLTSRHWRQNEEAGISYFSSHRGMTLLHLAASLGYTKLVAAMLHWRSENSSFLLETEVDALSQDEDGFTPLMWACARGHTETALMLYRWNHTALNIRNMSAQTALECARANSHLELAREVEKLESRREQPLMMLTTSDNPMLSPAPVSPASSILSIASTNKSHDGVFLRPGAVSSGGGFTSSAGRYSSTDTSGVHHKGQRLVKRPSVDSGINMTSGLSTDSLPSLRTTRSKTNREIPKLSRFDRSMSLPLNSPLSANDNSYDSSSDVIRSSPIRRMDYTLSEAARSNSPLIDVEAISDDEEPEANSVGEQDVRVLTLAEQIIAAMPDRIKNEIEDMQLDNSPKPSDTLSTDTLNDVFMEPLLEQSSTSFDNTEFNFEFSDHNYRYYDVGTPCSSLSPASSSCLQSPCSFTLDSPSPPPTTQDFCEFFQASGSVFEKDFSNLTLSDREQRELYEAAKIIQKAYRSYKGRQHNQLTVNQGCQQHEDKERAAAVLIQNYYRRYKQYAYFKQMTRAAMVIQSGYRSYCEHKRFKKSQEAAVCIQNYYRNYREHSRENPPASSSGLKRTYSQRRQHQAARKIQQFMRQSKNKKNEPKKRSRLSCSRRLSIQGHRVQGSAVWAIHQQQQPSTNHRNTNTSQQQQQQQSQQQQQQRQQQIAAAQTLQTVADLLNSGWMITSKKSSRV